MLILPAAILIIIYYLYPMLTTVYYAFTDMTLTGSTATATNFVGLRNLAGIVTDPKFPEILKNTLVFLVFRSPWTTVLWISDCKVDEEKTGRSSKIYRFYGGTWVDHTGDYSGLYVFSFFNDKGTLNMFVELQLGFKKVSWTFTYPMLSIVIANIWKGSAYCMLMFQAALDGISDDIIESAKIDGASKFDILRCIELPIIKGTTSTTFIMVTLGTLGTFGMIYAFTGGGPGVSTTTLSVYMYKQAFGAFQVGYGMAIALILLSIGALLSFVYLRVMKANQD